MRIELAHQLTMDEIKQRGDTLADRLVEIQMPGGVAIGNVAKSWSGDQMDFSFRASKGFFGADIKGQLLVSVSSAVLDIAVPPMVSSMVNEELIRGILTAKMAEIIK
jgi:hypothetical protein